MQEQIKQILNDLYKIDESFRAHEKDLIKLISRLLESRPDTQLDQAFIAELRNRVLKRAHELSTAKPRPVSLLINFMNMPKFAYAVAGAALTLIIAIPVFNMLNRGVTTPVQVSQVSKKLIEAPKIAKLENNAFGALVGDIVPPSITQEGRGSAIPAPQADSLAVTEESVSAKAETGLGGGGGASGMVTESRIIGMPAPDIKNYNFKYAGEDLTLSDSELPVYRRTKDDSLAKEYAKNVSSINFGLFNSGKLKNTEVVSLQIMEDREFGYVVYFNFDDNSLSINQNWQTWPRPDPRLGYEQLTEADVPSDDKLIALANAFLKEYGVDTNNYGEPQVNDFRRNQPRVLFEEGASYYIPDTIPVIYPYLLDSQIVYDQEGNVSGISVEVNIRHNRVSGAYGLVIPTYESSSYTAVTDSAMIIESAETGGLNRLYDNPDARETITLELGTPIRQLVRYFHYTPNQEKGGAELYIPALVFPVVNPEEAPGFWMRQVVVPLPVDILDNINQPPIGIPEPMPLLREGSAPGALPVEEETEAVEIDE